jgi:hypothetical protein
MARKVIARRNGDDYQDDFFWLQASRLLAPNTKVALVEYESDSKQFFDDVAVHYNKPLLDERGDLFQSDYYQVKFHVDYTAVINYTLLTDPKFIYAKNTSFLQGLKKASSVLLSDGQNARFNLVTTATIDPNDPLAQIVSTQNGEIRLEKLFDNKDHSIMAKVRKLWKEHLSLDNDNDLKIIIKNLRLQTSNPNSEQLSQTLNEQLCIYGLIPVETGSLINPYRELIRQLYKRGINKFNRDELLEHCSRENLCLNIAKVDESNLNLGIRSFLHWAEFLEDETDDLLDLLPYFDNRQIRNNTLWKNNIVPSLQNFLNKHIRDKRHRILYLDTHTSIAFTVGYILDTKCGLDISIMQRTSSGKELWILKPSSAPISDNYWNINKINLSDSSNIAIAISVTHNISKDVEMHVKKYLPEVGYLLNFIISPKPSTISIADGSHELNITLDLVHLIKEYITASDFDRVAHIFISAPNSFSFLLGRFGRNFGKHIIYEFNFDNNESDKYKPPYYPSIEFPISDISINNDPNKGGT